MIHLRDVFYIYYLTLFFTSTESGTVKQERELINYQHDNSIIGIQEYEDNLKIEDMKEDEYQDDIFFKDLECEGFDNFIDIIDLDTFILNESNLNPCKIIRYKKKGIMISKPQIKNVTINGNNVREVTVKLLCSDDIFNARFKSKLRLKNLHSNLNSILHSSLLKIISQCGEIVNKPGRIIVLSKRRANRQIVKIIEPTGCEIQGLKKREESLKEINNCLKKEEESVEFVNEEGTKKFGILISGRQAFVDKKPREKINLGIGTFDKEMCKEISDDLINSQKTLFFFFEHCPKTSYMEERILPEIRNCHCRGVKNEECKVFSEIEGVEWGLTTCMDKNNKTLYQLEFKDEFRSTSKKCWNDGTDSENIITSSDGYRNLKYLKEQEDEFCISKCLPSPCCMSNKLSNIKVNKPNEMSKTLDMFLCEKCFCESTPSECKTKIYAENNMIVIEILESSGYYKFHISNEMKEGNFQGSTTIQFYLDGPGNYILIGYCNKKKIEKNIIWTLDEFCMSKYGSLLEKPNLYYCKNYKSMQNLLIALIIFCIIYMMNGIFGKLLTMMLSIPLIPVVLLLKKRVICNRCLHFKSIWHRCNFTHCQYCVKKLISEKENMNTSDSYKYDMMRRHLRVCKNGGNNKEFFCIIVALMTNISKFLNSYLRKLCFLLFIVYMLKTIPYIKADEMKKVVDDMGTFINDLRAENYEFHPFKARFTGDLLSKESDINEVVDCNNDDCTSKIKLTSEFHLIEGKEFGYEFYTKLNKTMSMSLSLKFFKLKMVCSYKDLYKTYKVKQQSVSTDTCTENCTICLNNLKSPNSSIIFNITKSGSSSWNCDGIGCMSIGSGCTCSKCWCEEQKETEFTIKKSSGKSRSAALCLNLGGQGFCKNIDDSIQDSRVKVIQLRGEDSRCPNLIACDNKGFCYEGNINELDEFDEKFGSAQKTTGNILSVKREVEYEEICFFGRHRSIKIDKCCKDTFFHQRSLKMINATMGKGNILSLPIHDLGNWKVTINLPNLHYHKNTNEVVLKDISMKNCKGCYSCSEGSVCEIHFISNLNGYLPMECDTCISESKGILFKKGQNIIRSVLFCKEQLGSLNCTINKKFTVKGSYNLIEKSFMPHGNGELNVDNTKLFYQECENLFCVKGDGILGWFKGFGIYNFLLYVFIFFIILLALYIFKTILSAFRSTNFDEVSKLK